MPGGVGLVVEPGEAKRAAHVLRLGPARVDAMLLTALPASWTRLDATAARFDLLNSAALGGRVLPGWSRCCPECLAERPGVWDLRWRLTSVFACREHRVLLRDLCDACEKPVLSSSPRGLPTDLRGDSHLDPSRVPQPGCCPSPLYGEGRRCDAPYAVQPPVPPVDRVGLVCAQDTVDAAADEGDRDAGDDLHALAVLWSLTVDGEERGTLPDGGAVHWSGKRSRVLTRPGNTGLAAAAFSWAAGVRGYGGEGADLDAVAGRLLRRTPQSPPVRSALSPYPSPLVEEVRRSTARARLGREPVPVWEAPDDRTSG